MVFNTILRLYMARIKQTGNKLMAHCWACSQITSEYIIVFLVKSNRIVLIYHFYVIFMSIVQINHFPM